MILSAYTISPKAVDWLLSDINHYCSTQPIKSNLYDAYNYIKDLAEKRNNTITELLARYPDTTDILCCDSSYVSQVNSIRNLIVHYYTSSRDFILGGAVWSKQRMRITDLFKNYLRWDDNWSVAELKGFKFDDNKYRNDWLRVSSVPGIHIFPRSLWDNGVRYGAFEDTNKGCELTWFCNQTNIPCYIDFGTFFYRERIYPITKCIQVSLGLRTRLGLHKLQPRYYPKQKTVWGQNEYKPFSEGDNEYYMDEGN